MTSLFAQVTIFGTTLLTLCAGTHSIDDLSIIWYFLRKGVLEQCFEAVILSLFDKFEFRVDATPRGAFGSGDLIAV